MSRNDLAHVGGASDLPVPPPAATAAPEQSAPQRRAHDLPADAIPRAELHRILAAVLVGITVIFSNIYATQPILPLFSRTFHIVPAVSSLTVSVVVLGMGVAALLYGPLSDQVGRRPVMVTTAALLLVPTLGVALAPTFTIVLVCRALQGLLIPGATVVGLAYLQETLPVSWRGFSVSAYVSATALGGLVGRLQGGFLADAFGWRWAFASFVLTSAVSLVLMLVWIPRHKGQRIHLDGAWLARMGHVYLGLFAFFRQRRVIGGSLIGAALFFGFISIFTYIPYRMEQPPFSLSQSAISLLYLVYFVGFLVTPWTGRLSDRLGRRVVIGGGLTLMVAGLVLTAFNTLAVIVVGMTLLNIGLLAAHAAANAFVNDSTDAGTGSASSFYLVWYYLGGTVGPLVSGLAWQSTGWPGVLSVCFLSIFVALTSLLTLCG